MFKRLEDGETRGMLTTIIVILTHWLLTDDCHRYITSTADSNHGVSETGEQTQLLSLKEIKRRLATACNCLLLCVAAWRSKLRYLRMLYHAGVHPPFGFLPSTKESQRNLILRTVRAHCTNCELCAGNRCLVCTLAYVGILLLSVTNEWGVICGRNLSHWISEKGPWRMGTLGGNHICFRKSLWQTFNLIRFDFFSVTDVSIFLVPWMGCSLRPKLIALDFRKRTRERMGTIRGNDIFFRKSVSQTLNLLKLDFCSESPRFPFFCCFVATQPSIRNAHKWCEGKTRSARLESTPAMDFELKCIRTHM